MVIQRKMIVFYDLELKSGVIFTSLTSEDALMFVFTNVCMECPLVVTRGYCRKSSNGGECPH